jgi:Glycosyltransferase Family 4
MVIPSLFSPGRMGHAGAICFTVATSGGFPPRPGGLALAAHRVCRYLADAGFDVHVVTYSPDASTSSMVEDRLTVHRLAKSENHFKGSFAFQHFLRHLDSEVHFDLFHGFFLSSVPPSMAVAATPKNGSVRPVIALSEVRTQSCTFPILT